LSRENGVLLFSVILQMMFLLNEWAKIIFYFEMAMKKYFSHICKLKHTVNKVSSLRDLAADGMARP
jgi:hypothetical protein